MLWPQPENRVDEDTAKTRVGGVALLLFVQPPERRIEVHHEMITARAQRLGMVGENLVVSPCCHGVLCTILTGRSIMHVWVSLQVWEAC